MCKWYKCIFVYKCNIINRCTYMNNLNDSKLNGKVHDCRRSIKALFQNYYKHYDSDSSSHDIHEFDSDISINSDYNEKSSSQNVHNSIISKPVPQVIDEVNAIANAKEFSVVVYAKTYSHLSIQHDQPVHYYYYYYSIFIGLSWVCY